MNARNHRRLKATTAMLAVCGSALSFAATKTYTTTADFNTGTVIGVSTLNDELRLSSSGSTFPVLWIANAGEDTMTKFDTVTNKEIARYRTWFGPAGQPGHSPHLGNAFAGAAPSRTAVDVDGNAYVLNRHFDGRSAVLIKVLSNSFVDRNGNGVVDTSEDTNGDGIISDSEMKPLGDLNGDGIIQPTEIQDERIAWMVRVPDGIAAPIVNGQLGRSLCIAPNGNLWVGLFSASSYYEVSPTDGRTLRGPIGVGVTPYGCLVDRNNQLWSADLSSGMGRIDTVAGTSLGRVGLIDSNYGIAVDDQYVYFAGNASSYIRVNKATLAQDRPAQGTRFYSVGISVDGSGNIVTGTYLGGGITKYRPDGSVICTNTGYPNMSETRGVIADAQGNVWQVSVSGNLLGKYSASCQKLGTFPVGNSPYTYSDAAGLSGRAGIGDWQAVYDSLAAGTPWAKVSWNATVPQGAALQVSVRTSDNAATLPSLSFVDVANGADLSVAGRYIEVRTRLTSSTAGASPVVADITVQSRITSCDINADHQIDQTDIRAIRAGIGQTPTSGDPRDADGDGQITMLDVRKCTLACTRANCAP